MTRSCCLYSYPHFCTKNFKRAHGKGIYTEDQTTTHIHTIINLSVAFWRSFDFLGISISCLLLDALWFMHVWWVSDGDIRKVSNCVGVWLSDSLMLTPMCDDGSQLIILHFVWCIGSVRFRSDWLWFVALRSHKPYDIALCNHIIHRYNENPSVTDL